MQQNLFLQIRAHEQFVEVTVNEELKRFQTEQKKRMDDLLVIVAFGISCCCADPHAFFGFIFLYSGARQAGNG